MHHTLLILVQILFPTQLQSRGTRRVHLTNKDVLSAHIRRGSRSKFEKKSQENFSRDEKSERISHCYQTTEVSQQKSQSMHDR
jgi:hypothetical protein